MGKKVTRLTDKEIKGVKPSSKDKVLCDGDGLQLRVRTTGTKSWNFNYLHPLTRKRINMGLGAYPSVTLAMARKQAIDARAILAQGIDPKEHRNQQRQIEKDLAYNTLKRVSEQWFEIKKHSVSENYAEDVWRSLERYVFPKFGKIPISTITAPNMIQLLKPIEAAGHLETVKRLCQRLNEIMVFAVNTGLIFANPLSGINAGFKKPKPENMLSLKPEELPELMMTIANASIKRSTRCLIEWQLHTMPRPVEAAMTQWSEIDLEEKTWTIPAEKIKRRREHVIPLTDSMIRILQVMHPISGHREYVFPSDREPKSHCNSQTANMALKRMGFANRLVSHGLRSLASTTLNSEGFNRDLIEVALSHVDDNQVRDAYNHAKYLKRRRPMMEWWSNHIENASKGSVSVTGFRGFKIVS
ncbi:DUF4102 domain-containing protein [Parashewanella curva]|uniref:DUF4102 domain-containing protein n=1 Tax=Parashewanella curva TaxID=2338552 RepID=A0A3L8PSJ4_9GAMM|nr:integrase domain-containing protein [Parashewanella curva]RLV57789.1 DUF4102 domain-containing protein [Parashewanella curva]